MPKLASKEEPIITASIGGSFLINPNTEKLYPEIETQLPKLFKKELEQNHIVIAVIGGGPRARNEIEKAKTSGKPYTTDELDEVGINVTWDNARLVMSLLKKNKLPAKFHQFGSLLRHNIIYLRGGDTPGHTTDYAAIEAAYEAEVSRVLNITGVPGVHPVNHGVIERDIIIPDMTWDGYLSLKTSLPHAPGINVPFDREAALLAQEYGMTVVIIGGKDTGPVFDNVNLYLNGNEFTGTVIHP